MKTKLSNDLIDKRDERTKARKEIKKKMDSIIGLSYKDEEQEVMTLSATISTVADGNARLLDEGYCDNGFILKKGALEKYLNGQNELVTGYEYQNGAWKRTDVLNLTDDFVGTVNLGHQDFATHPFILGEFTKADLKLEDIGDGRKALNVGVRLDEDSMYIKELRRQPYDIGISAEFWYHVDWEATDSIYESYGMWLPVIDEIFIFAYGIVGECGNVNSSGLTLKGETVMPKDIKNMAEQLDVKEELEIPVTPQEPEKAEQPMEETPNEVPTETKEPIEAAEDNGEEAKTEEAEGIEPEGDEGEGDETVSLAEALSVVNALKDKVDELTKLVSSLTKEKDDLTEYNAKLKKTNRKLSGRLEQENAKKKEFIDGVKGLSTELLPGEPTAAERAKSAKESVAERNYYFGDGIGEI